MPYILFALSALLLAVFLNSIISPKKAERLFSTSLSSQEELRELILKNVSLSGIDSSSIQGYRDKNHVLHLKIELTLELYGQLEETLEKRLSRFHSPVIKKEKHQDSEKDYYLWEVKAKNEENLVVLFSCLKDIVGEGSGAHHKERRNKVAIIIDDMGYSLEALRKISSMRKALTVSILPFSPYAKNTAQVAHDNGLEIMLHLPLQSADDNSNNDFKGIILSGMSEDEVKKALEENLHQVPYIKGVNNHMGSKITADKNKMHIILERLKQMDLFFVDSVTTTKSIAFNLAQALGIPSARRHIFLDSINNVETIKQKLIQLFRDAQKEGDAVGICHPSDETLQVLMENIHLAEEYNVELVFASQIARTPSPSLQKSWLK